MLSKNLLEDVLERMNIHELEDEMELEETPVRLVHTHLYKNLPKHYQIDFCNKVASLKAELSTSPAN